MKTYITNYVFLLLLYLPIGYAQEVAPFKLGNIWVYDEFPSISRTTVIDTNFVIDTILYAKLFIEYNYGGLQYFLYMRLKDDGYYAFRRDTSYPAPNHEQIYYKKNAMLGDTWVTPDPWSPFDAVYTIEDTFVVNLFGEPTTLKRLTIDSGLLLLEEYWTEKFGKLSRTDFGTPISSLRGCVIDGVAYGDTSFNVVSVKYETGQPEYFILEQNYPNPFNSSTIINYILPEGSFITLEIFNVLGEKIDVLVNGFKPAGTYSLQFNADGLASGNYLCTLRTNNFIQTRKMQVLK
jgi:hypothetical protein